VYGCTQVKQIETVLALREAAMARTRPQTGKEVGAEEVEQMQAAAVELRTALAAREEVRRSCAVCVAHVLGVWVHCVPES
jgi:hypothetical protein